MKRKVDVTYDELMEFRKKGYSNRDIAKMLEISYPTVLRYIGKQGKKMDSVIKEPVRCGIKKPCEDVNVPKIQIVRQMAVVNGYELDVDVANGFATVSLPGENYLLKVSSEDVDKLKQALDVVKGMLVEAQDR